jgi:hypothetical protein
MRVRKMLTVDVDPVLAKLQEGDDASSSRTRRPRDQLMTGLGVPTDAVVPPSTGNTTPVM